HDGFPPLLPPELEINLAASNVKKGGDLGIEKGEEEIGNLEPAPYPAPPRRTLCCDTRRAT
ncbi:hypothetical protein K0M31_010826, partial [Melipona bicolor]